ncbi:DUF1648 domain-containing protein [Pseudonocardia sichuanensis]
MSLASDLVAVALVTVAFRALPALARPTLPFGVRVPPARVDDPAVRRERHRYGRWVDEAGALGAVVVVVLALLAAPAGVRAGAVTALGAADLAFFLVASRAVGRAKRAEDWYAGTRQGVTADTSLRTDPVRVPWAVLVPAVVVLLATAAVGVLRYPELPATLPALGGTGVLPDVRVPTTAGAAFAPVVQQAVLTVLMPALVAVSLRARPELDAADPAGSAARYRVYLRGLAVLLLGSTALGNLSLAVVAALLWGLAAPGPLATAALGVPLAVAGLAWVVFAVRVGEAGHRLPGGAAPSRLVQRRLVQRDDDRHWYLAGLVYGNRADPALLVHKRIGMGWTLNLGHPVAWAVLAGLVLLAVLATTGVIDLPARGGPTLEP